MKIELDPLNAIHTGYIFWRGESSQEHSLSRCRSRLFVRVQPENTYIFFQGKVHIFWEGHKILRNLHLTFDCMYCSQNLGEDFAKILWPSQNVWSLQLRKYLEHRLHHRLSKLVRSVFLKANSFIFFGIYILHGLCFLSRNYWHSLDHDG